MNNNILESLKEIKQMLSYSKRVLTVDELASYLGMKKSYIYKLVHKNEIPYSKPLGKMLFFEKEKIDKWILQNAVKSTQEIEESAIEYAFKNKRLN